MARQLGLGGPLKPQRAVQRVTSDGVDDRRREEEEEYQPDQDQPGTGQTDSRPAPQLSALTWRTQDELDSFTDTDNFIEDSGPDTALDPTGDIGETSSFEPNVRRRSEPTSTFGPSVHEKPEEPSSQETETSGPNMPPPSSFGYMVRDVEPQNETASQGPLIPPPDPHGPNVRAYENLVSSKSDGRAITFPGLPGVIYTGDEGDTMTSTASVANARRPTDSTRKALGPLMMRSVW